jgi:hypothetical protein
MARVPTLFTARLARVPTLLNVLLARCRRAGTALAMVAIADVFLDMWAPLAMRWIFFERGFAFPAPVK